MRQQLARTRNNKARERDDISPRTLKVCAAQLAGVFLHSFGLSLRLKKVPSFWKTSCIVLVLKKGCPSAPNDLRPVALSSNVMKTFDFSSAFDTLSRLPHTKPASFRSTG